MVAGQTNFLTTIEECAEEEDGVIFQRLGVLIPRRQSFEQHNFDTQTAIIVSNNIDLTLIRHPQGIYVTKTAKLLQLTRVLENNMRKESMIEELSIVDVPPFGASIMDEATRILVVKTNPIALALC